MKKIIDLKYPMYMPILEQAIYHVNILKFGIGYSQHAPPLMIEAYVMLTHYFVALLGIKNETLN